METHLSSNIVGVRVPPAVASRIEELAAVEGLSKSAWARRLIFRELAALDAPKSKAAA